MIYGNAVGGGSAQTYILEDETGKEIVAVAVESETAFDATANDIRLGKTAVNDSGVVTGEKFIPAYHTTEGFVITPAGSDVVILLDGGKCEYTKLQVLICAFNSTVDNSVATEMVSIDGKVYAVKSTVALATASVDAENDKINLGVTNESGKPYIVRFFTYKEE